MDGRGLLGWDWMIEKGYSGVIEIVESGGMACWRGYRWLFLCVWGLADIHIEVLAVGIRNNNGYGCECR